MHIQFFFQDASSSFQAVNPNYPITTNAEVMPVATSQQFVIPTSSCVPAAPPLGMMPLNSDQDPPPPSFSLPVAQSSHMNPLQGSPAREEGEVPESELDPDTRRRLLILQHGQDTRDLEPPIPDGPPSEVSAQPVQSHGNWIPVEGEMIPRNLNMVSTGFHLESDAVHHNEKQLQQSSYFTGRGNPVSSDRYNYQNQRYPSHVSDHEF
jgi:RNA polymerase II C-terminal domain phosphatase-like 1/2